MEKKRNRFWSLWGIIALILISWVGNVPAATTGKVTGTVKDAAGEGLPGANVVIKGTNRGATTDAQGHYIILAVEPGSHDVVASMVGYTSETKQDVQVVADYTTTVDFSLRESSLQLGEMVVVAQRPPVEPDKTTSKHVITAQDIEEVPQVRSATGLVALEPGMALDGSDRIRGSYVGDGNGSLVSYYVDGIEVGRTKFSDVNTSSIQEVSVLTGGMNAEFGNSMAGVVSLVTKEGGQSFSGKGEYKFDPSGKRHWGANLYDDPVHKNHIQWSNPDWVNEVDPQTGQPVHQRTDYTGHMGHRVEASLSGPLAKSASFFASSSYDLAVSGYPSAAPTSPFNTQNQANITFRPSENIKVKIGGLYERNKQFYFPNGNWEGVGKGMGPNSTGRNIFLPEDWAAAGRQINTEDLAYVDLTHNLGAKTFYELKLYRQGAKTDTSDVPDVTEPVRTDAEGWYYLPRKIRAYYLFSDQRYGLKFDFTSQVTKSHLFQTGFEVKRHDYYETTVSDGPTTKDRNIDFVGKDWTPGSGVTPWEAGLYAQDKLEYGGIVINAGVRWDYLNYGRKERQAPGMELSPMFRTYTHRLYENQYMESSTPHMTALSPRIGISHPITDRLSGHYFIGQFHTFPQLVYLYRMTYTSQEPDVDLNGNGVIDPAEQGDVLDAQQITIHATDGMKPAKSTNVEMGVDWNFYQDYTGSLTAYYRADEGLYGTNSITYWDGPVEGMTSQVGALRNAVWSNSRGGELSLHKDFSHNFSFRIAYNLQWVYGIGYDGSSPHYGNYEGNWYVYPDSNYIASGRYWYKWQVQSDGSEVPVPLTTDEIQTLGAAANQIVASWAAKAGESAATGYYSQPFKINDAGLWATCAGYGAVPAPKGWDVRNQLSVQLYYATPKEYGPRVWGFHPFGNLKASSVYRLISGNPFDYVPPVGQTQLRTSSPRMRTDLHVEKDFGRINGVDARIFLEVTNLFNEQEASPENSAYINYGLEGPAPDDPDYLKYGDGGDWNRYVYAPRHVQLGLTFSF